MALVLALAAFTFALTVEDEAAPPAPTFPASGGLTAPGSLALLTHRLRHAMGDRAARVRWLPGGHIAGAPAPWRPTTVAFYTPDDDGSVASLRRHLGAIDWVSAADFNVVGPDHVLTEGPDPKLGGIVAGARHPIRLMPLVQNAREGVWEGANAAALLHDRVRRGAFLDELTAALARYGARGAVFDFEELPGSAQGDYRAFLGEAAARWHPRGWLVTLAAPVGDPDWDLAAYGRVADRVLLMAYDEHWESGAPGPVASQPWFVERVRQTVAAVGADKAIVCLGNYAYDWTDGVREANELTVEEAWTVAHDSEARIRFDPASGNATFDYADERGRAHHVWLLDAASIYNHARAARALGARGIAIWRLGAEDPGMWAALANARDGSRPEIARLATTNNVDLEGAGELLRIADTPADGARTLRYGADGLIHDERFDALPTPFVVQRAGAKPGLVALTFDDGPDPAWTPAILDVLAREHVPATFFIVGENAVDEAGLLRRIVADGHEIGNHSYTHPNMANASPEAIRLELNTTQRLIESYTGHSTRLFRAPFFGDAEPTTADELLPALAAQRDGYLNVGLHVDPDDWQRPGADAIVARTVRGITDASLGEAHGNIVLLHDAGGDRSQTVAALPRIIAALRARGYRFVPVSELAGLSAALVNPPVSAPERLAVAADASIFAGLATLQRMLGALFAVAIGVGIARALMLAVLAVGARAAERRRAMPPAWTGSSRC